MLTEIFCHSAKRLVYSRWPSRTCSIKHISGKPPWPRWASPWQWPTSPRWGSRSSGLVPTWEKWDPSQLMRFSSEMQEEMLMGMCVTAEKHLVFLKYCSAKGWIIATRLVILGNISPTWIKKQTKPNNKTNLTLCLDFHDKQEWDPSTRHFHIFL